MKSCQQNISKNQLSEGLETWSAYWGQWVDFLINFWKNFPNFIRSYASCNTRGLKGQKIAHLEQFPQMPSWIPYQNDFSNFWSTRHPSTSYQVLNSFAFGFRGWQNRFSRWLVWQQSWISDLNNFSYFFIYVTTSFQLRELSVQEKFKIDFQNGCDG